MEKTLNVALILKPQGIKGEVKVKVLTDTAEDLAKLPRVFIDGKEYKILNVRPQGDCAFVTFKGIADRNAAEALRGKDVIVNREDIPELPADRFYIVDVLGCKVVSQNGKTYGTICEITPARTDIYTVDTGDKKVPFAAVDGVIVSIDVQNKIMTVDQEKFSQVALFD
jgi:16S rRNA processing protein RimM